VQLPWEYEWSSCRAYALGEANELLSYKVWYQDLGSEAARRQERWRVFLLGDDSKEEIGEEAGVEAGVTETMREGGNKAGRCKLGS
jgi:hypothetical protein